MSPPGKSSRSPSRADSAVILISVIALAAAVAPTLWGRALTPAGFVYSSFAYVLDDSFTYLSKMRQGYEGAWLCRDLYTTEPHRPAALFEFYLALGHFARLTGLGTTFVLHLARLVGSAALLFCWDRLLRAWGFIGRERVLAFFLGVFGGGLGWLGWATGRTPNPMEFWLHEAHGFSAMLVFAHFAWSSALMLAAITELMILLSGRFSTSRASAWSMARLGAAMFLVAWIHPRLTLNVVAVGACMAGIGAAWGLWPIRRAAAPLAVALASAGVVMAAIVLSYRGDPVWEAWAATPLDRPTAMEYFVLFGLLWPLAAWGAVHAWRSRAPWGAALIAWAVVGAILPWLPLASSRRLMQGYAFPLAALSAVALARGAGKRVERKFGRRASGGFLGGAAFALAITPALHWGLGFRDLFGHRYPWFISRERLRAMEWLRVHSGPEDVVLCAPESGLLVPAYAGRTVVVGHWAETLEASNKFKYEILPLFAGLLTPEQRVKMFNLHQVTFLIMSGAERRMVEIPTLTEDDPPLVPYAPESDPGVWSLAWTSDGVDIYRRNIKVQADEPKR